MVLYDVQVVFPNLNSMPEDACTNTWHFDIDGADLEVSASAATQSLMSFYDDAYAPFRSTRMLQTGILVSWYLTGGPTPRVPEFQTTEALLVASTENTALPPECSVVASFQAVRLAGTNQARRRNRVYLPPMNYSANETTYGRVSSTCQLAIRDAMLDLSDKSDTNPGGGTWRWRVYSPTDAQALRPENGWVDNAWDTQRRRGIDASVRQVWSDPAVIP